MKNIIKISCLALLLCIGFIPNSTGASFEPAKTALYIGESNPGNYSLLQYAIDHGSAQEKNTACPGMQYTPGTTINNGYCIPLGHEAPLVHQMMSLGHRYQVPFHLIGLFFSNQPANVAHQR
jgi:hypothetical protein